MAGVSFILTHPAVGLINFREQTCSRSWATLVPGGSRDPVPKEVVFWFATWFLQHQFVEAAVWTLLAYDACGRPSGVLSLDLASIGRLLLFYVTWSITLALMEVGGWTAAGTRDDAVIVGDLPCRRWFATALSRWCRHCEQLGRNRLFILSRARPEECFRRASLHLDVVSLRTSRQSIRHSGPLNVIYHGLRSDA